MKVSKLAIGAIIGAAAGVVTGVLTAPKSGKETRDDIKKKASDTKDKVVLQADELLFKAEEISGDIRAKAGQTIETVTAAVGKRK